MSSPENKMSPESRPRKPALQRTWYWFDARWLIGFDMDQRCRMMFSTIASRVRQSDGAFEVWVQTKLVNGNPCEGE
jgi:hypothetical protein